MDRKIDKRKYHFIGNADRFVVGTAVDILLMNYQTRDGSLMFGYYMNWLSFLSDG